jgi:environmental stress-induced protein Ves
MPARVLGPADFTAMPWRNGKGTTLELAREDDANGAMLWRLSSADVVEDGAFSPFPGIDRILMLTEGEGFDLDFGEHGRVAPVGPLVPVRFSGDWATRAENVRGPSRDLNVMLARGHAKAGVGVHHEAIRSTSLADRSMMLVLRGTFAVAIGREAFTLAQSHVLLVSGSKGRTATTSGSGLLVQIDIHVLPPE